MRTHTTIYVLTFRICSTPLFRHFASYVPFLCAKGYACTLSWLSLPSSLDADDHKSDYFRRLLGTKVLASPSHLSTTIDVCSSKFFVIFSIVIFDCDHRSDRKSSTLLLPVNYFNLLTSPVLKARHTKEHDLTNTHVYCHHIHRRRMSILDHHHLHHYFHLHCADYRSSIFSSSNPFLHNACED